jgi:MFS family permease
MGISKSLTFQYQGISSVLALIAQMVCIASIDKIGRRWAMIGGNLANCLFFTIATIMLAVFPPATNSNASASWAFIVVTWLYNISFSATNGPLSWIVPAEIFDTRTRSKGVSIGVMVSFAFNTMIGQVTPIAMEKIGWKFYILFVVCNFTNALYFWATQPETKKRPLEEMNYLFTNAPYVPTLYIRWLFIGYMLTFLTRWFVPTMDMKDFTTNDLQHRAEEVERKGSIMAHDEGRV